MRQHSLIDLSLGVFAVVVVCALAWSLHARNASIPKVLAQSSRCPAGSCTPGSTRRVSEGGYSFDETCNGYPQCGWNRPTVDPIINSNDSYCCFSTGHSARCDRIRAGVACQASLFEPDVRSFTSEPDNQWACEVQRVLGVCNGSPSSSSSSSAASCGNNVVETSNGEECDWGGNNSDTLPNRCRKNCKFPSCGDKMVDDNFSDPASGTVISEECDNIEYLIDGKDYPAVSSTQWTWNAHGYCNSDCTVKQPTVNPLFFMFPSAIENPLYVVRNVFDWNSIFFPLSSLGF